jgi:hypothetical protein
MLNNAYADLRNPNALKCRRFTSVIGMDRILSH